MNCQRESSAECGLNDAMHSAPTIRPSIRPLKKKSSRSRAEMASEERLPAEQRAGCALNRTCLSANQ